MAPADRRQDLHCWRVGSVAALAPSALTLATPTNAARSAPHAEPAVATTVHSWPSGDARVCLPELHVRSPIPRFQGDRC